MYREKEEIKKGVASQHTCNSVVISFSWTQRCTYTYCKYTYVYLQENLYYRTGQSIQPSYLAAYLFFIHNIFLNGTSVVAGQIATYMQQPTAENATQHEIVHDLKGPHPQTQVAMENVQWMFVGGWVNSLDVHRGKMTLFTIILENFLCHLRQSIFFFYNTLWPLFFRPLPSPLLSAIFFKQKYIYIATSFCFCSVVIDYLYIHTEQVYASRAEKRYDTGYLLNVFKRFNFIKAATKTIYR